MSQGLIYGEASWIVFFPSHLVIVVLISLPGLCSWNFLLNEGNAIGATALALDTRDQRYHIVSLMCS